MTYPTSPFPSSFSSFADTFFRSSVPSCLRKKWGGKREGGRRGGNPGSSILITSRLGENAIRPPSFLQPTQRRRRNKKLKGRRSRSTVCRAANNKRLSEAPAAGGSSSSSTKCWLSRLGKEGWWEVREGNTPHLTFRRGGIKAGKSVYTDTKPVFFIPPRTSERWNYSKEKVISLSSPHPPPQPKVTKSEKYSHRRMLYSF